MHKKRQKDDFIHSSAETFTVGTGENFDNILCLAKGKKDLAITTGQFDAWCIIEDSLFREPDR
jgi:hypothetical protein